MNPSENNLSSDEMASLRDVTEPAENSGKDAKKSAKVEVSTYNFRQPGRLSSAQLRALKVVHEFFAKRLSEDRPSSPDLPVELALLSVETVSYSNFMGSLGNPCFMAQLSSRFEQTVLMDIDLPLVRLFISRILGDVPQETETVKAPTAIEQSIAGNWIEGMLPLLGESWRLSAPVDFGLESIECDPRFVQVMPDDSPVVCLSFRLQAGAASGNLTLCYPLEPLQELLEGMSLKMSGSDEEDETLEQGGARILASLKAVPFELRAELGRCTIQASQLATLRRGDVLCLDRSINDSVDIFLENNLVFSAGLGRKDDTLSLQINRRRTER